MKDLDLSDVISDALFYYAENIKEDQDIVDISLEAICRRFLHIL